MPNNFAQKMKMWKACIGRDRDAYGDEIKMWKACIGRDRDDYGDEIFTSTRCYVSRIIHKCTRTL